MTNAEAIAEIGVTLHEGALSKVSRFYNGTEMDILPELFQNARRGGATRVEVETNEQTGIVTVRDNGVGISNYHAVLGFGQSEWADTTIEDEDPAGIGLFSLSRRHWDVTSHRAGEKPWTVAIGPEHFDAAAPAEVYEANPATPIGTTVRFATERVKSAIAAARHAAKHCPLSVVIDGAEVERHDFLEDAIWEEEWRGLRIGAYSGRVYGLTMNFHGLTIQYSGLPAIEMLGKHWGLRVDVARAPELALVLPARRDVVASPFLEELKVQGRLVLLRAIANADPPPRVSAAIWREARAAGIELPAAMPELKRFEPLEADVQYPVLHDNWGPWLAIRPNAVIVDVDSMEVGPAAQQSFMRAAELGGLDERLLAPIREYEGFDWYDRIPRIVDIEIIATVNGEEHRFRDVDATDTAADAWLQGHADRIVVAYTTETAGRRETRQLESDLALSGEAYSWFGEECHMLVTKDAALSPVGLTNLLVAAFFSRSDDIDSDSPETQQTRFAADAESWAVETLVSPEKALEYAVERALDHVKWQLAGRGAVARIARDGSVKVRVGRKRSAPR